jgi:hypothetical protein
MATTNIPALISTIIESIRDTAAITNITHVGNTYTIFTPLTKRLTVGSFVKISGNDYQIISLISNVSFSVTSSINIIGTNWIAMAPYYFYGNAILISNTLDKIKNYQQKFPIIILYLPISTTDNRDETLNIETTANLSIDFMDEACYQDWSADEYITNVVMPLQVYVDDFFEALENSPLIGVFTNNSRKIYDKWILQRENGKNVFNSELSGIGLSIDLPILKQLICSDV